MEAYSNFNGSLFLILLLFPFSSCIAESHRKELRPKNEVNQTVIKQFDSVTQPNKVDPSRVVQLSWRPRVFLYRGFLTDEECNHLVSMGIGQIRKTFVEDVDSRKIARSIQDTSSLISVGTKQDDIVTRIEDRISAWSFFPKGNSEPMQITHYTSEETKEIIKSPSIESVAATVILYLSNVTHGGETLFPQSSTPQVKDVSYSDCAKTGYAVKPIKGNALLYFTLLPNSSPDESSSHVTCPVFKGGESWSAVKNLHLRAIEPKEETMEPEIDGCSDEEDSCPRWAAIGECDRNPVFMKGTPDYSGACRKSCKACQ